MISEKTRISNVKVPETMTRLVFPKTMADCRPTPAAPTAFAIVFKERMAARGG